MGNGTERAKGRGPPARDGGRTTWLRNVLDTLAGRGGSGEGGIHSMLICGGVPSFLTTCNIISVISLTFPNPHLTASWLVGSSPVFPKYVFPHALVSKRQVNPTDPQIHGYAGKTTLQMRKRTSQKNRQDPHSKSESGRVGISPLLQNF